MIATSAPEEKRQKAVFLVDFVDLELPIEIARSRIGSDGVWLAPLVSRATADAESRYLRLGSRKIGSRRGIEICIRLGQFASHGEECLVPLRWEAVRLTSLFPVLDGNIELAPIGSHQCRLLLHAAYRPPLDGFGRILDSALLHRVAESTVRSFLHQVAETLEDDSAGVRELPAT